MSATLYEGDALTVLRTLPDGAARCCVTSPPYWGLRDYGHAGQLGLERTPEEYVANLVAVFHEVRRVLADDGTLWLNLGDSYAAARGGTTPPAETLAGGVGGWTKDGERVNRDRHDGYNPSRNAGAIGLKHKDLVGIPWRVAFALQADGWYLRSDIIWAKPNPMPESVTDRPTKSHEYLFLLAKQERYYYNADAIKEGLTESSIDRLSQPTLDQQTGSARVPSKTNGTMKAVARVDRNWDGRKDGTVPGKGEAHAVGTSPGANLSRAYAGVDWSLVGRNARTVWTIPTQPYAEAHFATFPEELARRCILAGSAPGDTVLDPFGGSGTVAQVATGNGRSAIHIDLNPAYHELARQRIGPMLCGAIADADPATEERT